MSQQITTFSLSPLPEIFLNCLNEIKSQFEENRKVDESLREYVYKVCPSRDVDNIMNSIIELSSNNVENLRVGKRALETFLGPTTRIIVMRNYSQAYTFPILKIILERCRDLEVLDLTGFQMLSRDPSINNVWREMFAQIVMKLKELRILRVDDMIVPNSSLFKLIFQSCPLLSELNLIGNGIYDSKTLGDLGGLQQLEKLELGLTEYEDNVDIIARILRTCPKIKSIDYPYTGHAIERLGGKQLALTKVADRWTSAKILDSIVECCPHLRSISLEKPQRGILSRLASLSKLQEIKVVHFKNDEILGIIRRIGSQLRRLVLEKSDWLDLVAIMKCTLNLESLELSDVEVVASKEEAQVFCPSLMKFVIRGRCLTESHEFYKIFFWMSSIRHLDISFWSFITDQLIAKIIESGVWKNLKYFETRNTKLTSQTVEYLLNACHLLEEIRGLDIWQVSRAELKRIREQMRTQGRICHLNH